MSAEDIYNLMKNVQGQLEVLLGREEPITKAELVAYSKVVEAKAFPVQDPVQLARQLLPQLISQLPKQLPLKVEPKTEEIVKLLSPIINQQAIAIQATNEQLLRSLPQYLAAIEGKLAAQLSNLKAQEASFREMTASIPKEVKVNYTGSRLKSILLAFGPMLALFLTLRISNAFLKDPIATYNNTVKAYQILRENSLRLKKQNDTLQRVGSAQLKELEFYRNQVHQYRKKFPKSASSLPPYLPAKK